MNNIQKMKPVRTLHDCEDLFERHLCQEVQDQGFSTVHQPGWCYTVGLWKSWQHPELIVFGLPAQRGQVLLQMAARRVAAGQKLEGVLPDLAEEYALEVQGVDPLHYRDYLPYARWFYRGPHFEAAQLLWPDPDHRLPSDPRFQPHLHELQPQLQ